MPSIEIRIGTAADSAALAEVGAETFRETYATHPEIDEEDLERYIERTYTEVNLLNELLDDEIRFLIAESEGRTAGYCRLVFGSRMEGVSGKRPVEISRIYLLKDFQGSGNGRGLLERAIEEGRKSCCDEVWLSVWEYNENAIGFYEKMGFKKNGVHYFDLAGAQHTDHLMVMPLNVLN